MARERTETPEITRARVGARLEQLSKLPGDAGQIAANAGEKVAKGGRGSSLSDDDKKNAIVKAIKKLLGGS